MLHHRCSPLPNNTGLLRTAFLNGALGGWGAGGLQFVACKHSPSLLGTPSPQSHFYTHLAGAVTAVFSAA